MKKHLLLILILILAFLVRFFRINDAPARLTHDEMSIGYNAYSLIKTGQDEWGKPWPLSFEAFGDHKLPGYIYATIPFISTLGLNTLSLKLPSIIAGLFIITFSYLIALKLTNNKTAAITTALVLTFNPWSIHLSRMAFESNLALALFTGGLFFSLQVFEKEKTKKSLLLAGILFALSAYTYVAFRLISVLTLVALSTLRVKNKLEFKKTLLIWVSFIILLVPLLPQLLGKSGSARFAQVSVFNDQGIEAKVIEQRNFCFLQNPTILPKVCKILFNKYGYLIEKVSTNYLSFLLPSFLFLDGDKLEYLNDPDFAQFLTILLPFYLIGLYKLATKKTAISYFVLAIFFLAPIASALAGPPQIVRGSALLPIIAILIGLGFASFLDLIKAKQARSLAMAISGLVFIVTFAQYFVSYQYIYSARSENYIYPLDQRSVTYLNSKEASFDTIYISNHFPDAHILLAFYNKIDPAFYQKNIVRPDSDKLGFSHPTKLGKYEFGDLPWHDLLCRDQNRTLFVTFNDELPKEWLLQDHLHLIKDFSGVHTQVQFLDLSKVRNYLSENKLLEATCGK